MIWALVANWFDHEWTKTCSEVHGIMAKLDPKKKKKKQRNGKRNVKLNDACLYREMFSHYVHVQST